MNSVRFAVSLLAMLTMAKAEIRYEDTLNMLMCRTIKHRFKLYAHECIYCAHGLRYDPHTLECKGTLDVQNKCFGEDHYHKTMRECIYCAAGYAFNKGNWKCEKVNRKQK